MTGKNNEDRYAVSSFNFSVEDPRPVVFAVVSDGIGGHGLGDAVALSVIAAQAQQQHTVLRAFYPFGDDAALEHMGQRDDAFDQCQVALVVKHVMHK